MGIADTVLTRVDRFPIEVGHIMIFARAIGDPNPIYTDEEYARGTALGSIVAPPTFTEAAQHFDADFPFRWQAGRPWFGSGRTPTTQGAVADDGSGTNLHAETHFEYFEPIRPGMVLCASSEPGNTWTKTGRRSGLLRFRDWVTDYRTIDENTLCVRCRTVGVTTARTITDTEPSAASAANGTPPDAHADAAPVTDWPVRTARAADLVPGRTRHARVVENLSRAQIIQYAGASGDFSPQHTDEVYNTQVAGYPSVFAHGMLSMAMTGRMLTDWLGDGRLTRFGVRFVRQVWPGDDLVASAVVQSVDADAVAPLVHLDVTTRNQHGHPVLTGYATARVES